MIKTYRLESRQRSRAWFEVDADLFSEIPLDPIVDVLTDGRSGVIIPKITKGIYQSLSQKHWNSCTFLDDSCQHSSASTGRILIPASFLFRLIAFVI